MKVLVQYLAVAAGGAVGAVARYVVADLCGRFFGIAFPIGTFVINISGSFFLGWFLATIGNRVMMPDAVRLAIAVGFVGAYTTFSTFMYESNGLLQDGSGVKATVNLLGSVLVGLLAVRLGVLLATR